ncbi:hypothetical protein Jab_2c14780 [Janthinobacterium sp. HH01]|uniref:Uncharacterized protein n=1 Tax=Rugamonas rivuli TaxID=2743358 RepID=A0A843S5W3_9BURK|nr:MULTISPECIES: hypothetical protein [Oxalobacteraceae]ELX09412.1 hypothetical protein Jab_2c14780 [Janthinobacterium sp. HH01]MQA19735.1 hypothetical protein [Rugamonas rivuli]
MMRDIAGPAVVAYHGCDLSVATDVVSGSIPHLLPSKNPYDWLGDGIYFFEDDPVRAQKFAETAAEMPALRLTAKPILRPYAVGAVIRLGHCLDLSKQNGIDEFRLAYETLVQSMGEEQELPTNRAASQEDKEGILHHLDRAIINFIHGQRLSLGQQAYDTVRGFFWQGAPVCPTSAIGRLSHVQIAVRNTACVLGYFHPQSPTADRFQGLERIPPPPYRKKIRSAK